MAKVIVVGGGPSGIMAAISAAQNNHQITLIERNEFLGKKLKLTGGGRCNITNNRYIEDFFDKVVNNNKFLYSSFYSFTNEDLLNYLSSIDVEYKIEEENDLKVYTKNDKALDLIKSLEEDLKNKNVEIIYNKKVTDLIIEEDQVKGVVINDDIATQINQGENLYADKVILSTGGKSYAHTGSDGSMYQVLENHGHTITKTLPALCPLKTAETWVKNLQGISMKNVKISTKLKKKKISKCGDMIFTHFGISGPVVLIIDSYINKVLAGEHVEIFIDFMQDTSKEEIISLIRNNPNKNISTNLKTILPDGFVRELLNILNLSDVKGNSLTKEDENSIVEYIKNMKLTITSSLGFKGAMVTCGGVSTKEVDASTLESKKIKNLFITGELLDLDAETGGYNLQIAFSTGYLAGLSL
ncbi:NAD(P)/FAD-dependent oxidoreductase [Intestinibacter bartlettii]|uniref:NAD(P)/FAD-dependent oxidoreductase n=2 Tax=Intestinibacter bartlettii TaxID=261299 RepID=A0ABS6DWF8_9FIRM|nr:NAD(P)/FAD-dependent oxidoreductase [Intestinibacter bartlettii]MBU5336186.1 NAD(P)/FAD-dependent oxidoreductase [Intestinibacter bartlettii]